MAELRGIVQYQIREKAKVWLKLNRERMNADEKEKFWSNLDKFLTQFDGHIKGTGRGLVIFPDDVYDFFIQTGLMKDQPREQVFLDHIQSKYGDLQVLRVLDVGAGRMCKLSRLLTSSGAIVDSIDPNIRLTTGEAKYYGIRNIYTKKFACDEYSRKGGTDISRYTHIFGLEPCEATEHIVRQGLKYDKPFEISLCGTPHKSLDGREFGSYKEWYDYLLSISKELKIEQIETDYYLTNN